MSMLTDDRWKETVGMSQGKVLWILHNDPLPMHFQVMRNLNWYLGLSCSVNFSHFARYLFTVCEEPGS